MVNTAAIMFFLLALLSSNSWALNNIEMSVDKNPVVVNETFTLQVSADDSLDTDQFDPSFLLRQKLIVGSTSVSKQVRVINGSSHSQTVWSTTLQAKKPGDYNIPAITIDGITSNRITIKVQAANQLGQASSSATQAIKLLTSVSKDEALPSEMLFYKVELQLSAELARGANLSEPELSGGTVKQLGKQQQESKIINGKRVTIIRLNYSVSIDKPGNYSIKGPTLEGQMLVKSGSGYYARNRLEPVLITGQDQAIHIKALANNIPKNTVVSPFVSLSQQWQPKLSEKNTVKVGEAITRTITLMVANQGEEQLPELKPSYPASIRHYTDEINSEQLIENETLFARLIHKEAIIATKEGKLTIDELKLPWYNTRTGHIEYATLPAQTFMVTPSEQPLAGLATSSNDKCPSVSPPASAPPSLTNRDNTSSYYWQYLAALLFLLLLISLAFLLRSIKSKPSLKQQTMAAQTDASERALKQACNALSNLSAATAAQYRLTLLNWAKAQWPERKIKQLSDIPNYATIKPRLKQLDQALWARDKTKSRFNSDDLFKQIMQMKKQESEKTETGRLNP